MVVIISHIVDKLAAGPSFIGFRRQCLRLPQGGLKEMHSKTIREISAIHFKRRVDKFCMLIQFKQNNQFCGSFYVCRTGGNRFQEALVRFGAPTVNL